MRYGICMFLRALIAFLILPGFVGFAVPAAMIASRDSLLPRQPLGLAVFAVGLFTLLWCVRDFYVAGKGTLAPWAPPKNLVRVGLYRYCRNPMYVSVGLGLCGWAVIFGGPVLWIYALLVVIGFHIRVVGFEEPWLAEHHGEAYERYLANVPRWLL